jgi:hypothetical protein
VLPWAALVAASARRADIIAIQDELVSKAESGVADAAVGVIEVSGLDRTALAKRAAIPTRGAQVTTKLLNRRLKVAGPRRNEAPREPERRRPE